MGTGQLRYWSICSYSVTTVYYACLDDESIPVDAERALHDRRVDRRRAARHRYAAPAASAGSRAAPGAQTHLFVRHLLASPDFAEALQHVEPGHEEAQMGDYYPRGTYYANSAVVERLGCP